MRFARLLVLCQLRPALELVVLVASPLREHRPEDLEVLHHAFLVLTQPRRHPGVEIASRGVEGAAQRPGIRIQCVAEPNCDRTAHVDDIDPGARGEFQAQFEGGRGHGYGRITRPPRSGR